MPRYQKPEWFDESKIIPVWYLLGTIQGLVVDEGGGTCRVLQPSKWGHPCAIRWGDKVPLVSVAGYLLPQAIPELLEKYDSSKDEIHDS